MGTPVLFTMKVWEGSMKEKVVELLMYIMSEMRGEKSLGEIDLSDLKSRGYTQSEISQAFSWLLENVQMQQAGSLRTSSRSRGSRRVLHDAEKFVLSTESQGYLIQMREIGLLNEDDLETVIERAMASGYDKLTPAELQEIVASVLFSRPGGDRGSHPSLLEGDGTVH